VVGSGPPEQRPLSPAERRRRNHEEVRAAILIAARAAMRANGVAGLSLHEVARRVGMRPQSLYGYFPSKMALYDALFREGIRLYRASLLRLGAEPTGDAIWVRFRQALEAYMGFAQEHPDLYQLVFERPVPGFIPSPEGMDESRRMLAAADELIGAALAAGAIAPGVAPERARDLILAMLHGLTALHQANEPDLPVGEGRFGGLIPAAVALFRAAWEPRPTPASTPAANGTSGRRP
jgi:AcrR family transcriptional regulator